VSAFTESELQRGARRVLRLLVRGAYLERRDDGNYALVTRAKDARHAKTKVEARLADAVRAKGWLRAEPGDSSKLFVSEAGRGWLMRCRTSVDPFADQHRLLRKRTIVDAQGSERMVTVNAAESPLTWMHQRGLIGPVQCQAGEKLRRDYTMAQLSPRLGVDWSAPITLGRRAAKPAAALSDIVLAAKQRFAKAMTAVGPGLSDILFDVCCDLNGLEQSERCYGWPRASAKVVLKIALDRLAAHYGMRFAAAPRRLRSWTKENDENTPSSEDSLG
jgi:hypothetical protein